MASQINQQPPPPNVNSPTTKRGATDGGRTNPRPSPADTARSGITPLEALSNPPSSAINTSSNGGTVQGITLTAGSQLPSIAVSNSGANSDSQSTSAGLTSSEKIGVGVGVGVGVAAIAIVAALLLYIRWRRRNAYEAVTRITHSHNHPAMASGTPALVGAAEIGRSRSPSPSSQPRTPSQGSMAIQEPVDATGAPQSQQSRSRTPPRLSLVLPSKEEEKDVAEQSTDFSRDMPSPMEEEQGTVSPLSATSPTDSRPPSPLRDDEK